VTNPDDLASPDLDARYGRSVSSKRQTRWILGLSAAAFVAVFGAWLVWGGLLEAPAQFEAQDTGHDILSESEVAVRWEFSAPPGSTARCAVQALNSTFGIVGWRVVDIGASTDRTRTFTETVRTTEQAVTGLIYRCWLT
jgi:ABC-type nickel/cobalt efflux system permease component RcnA